MAEQAGLPGPDLGVAGVAVADLRPGEPLLGHAGGKPVLLLRTAAGCRAVGARCTHYGASLGRGVFDGALVRCASHHACFDADTGRAVRAPALSPLPIYRVEERHGQLFVGGPVEIERPRPVPPRSPASVLIVGTGAAAAAAAERLREEGYQGPVSMIGAEADGPIDRPNLSKDFLAGTAPEDWMPLRSPGFYAAQGIEVVTARRVIAIDVAGHRVRLDGGEERPYGALLLATGAEPVRLPVPGPDLPLVHYLRSLADSRAIIAAAEASERAVVVGAGFIGLEVAASLRARGLQVAVVAPEAAPLAALLGPEVAALIRAVHEENGVHFHLSHTVARIEQTAVTLDDGTVLPADLVVAGVGVRPRVQLAAEAGLEVDRGILVDQYLATTAPDIWAAGDVARWPHPRFGLIRVEHWVVAQRQGQTAAANILGAHQPHTDIPFFWSQHYGLRLNFVGQAAGWDEVRLTGSVPERKLVAAYLVGGKVQAVTGIRRDQASLWAEVAFERGDETALQDLANIR
jgi:NADPH-dependent 2,4-dienoyl-CoA reductase/sulfur reductase-like enzyme/nitrite reductase/ring-hydroxylating ferredoxin subunit